MTILRQFIIAPSPARLIWKERGDKRMLEGYFPDQPQRRRLALDGAPDAPGVDVTNTALNSLLDLLEDRFIT
jgi:hypothetical protein